MLIVVPVTAKVAGAALVFAHVLAAVHAVYQHFPAIAFHAGGQFQPAHGSHVIAVVAFDTIGHTCLGDIHPGGDAGNRLQHDGGAAVLLVRIGVEAEDGVVHTARSAFRLHAGPLFRAGREFDGKRPRTAGPYREEDAVGCSRQVIAP